MVSGFNIQTHSLGYLCERASIITPSLSFCQQLSRASSPRDCFQSVFWADAAAAAGGRGERAGVGIGKERGEREERRWGKGRGGKEMGRAGQGFGASSGLGIYLTGRVILNVWRLLRIEVTCARYSYQALMFQILGERVPHYSYSQLTAWWKAPGCTSPPPNSFDRTSPFSPPASGTPSYPCCIQVMLHQLKKAQNCLCKLLSLNFFGKTSELARVFGIEFFHVHSRGAQFRVEAMLLRLTKPMNYVLISPDRARVAKQKAPECLPLVMEPESRYYSSPVLVLDFRSLYLSLMIAYNCCYSYMLRQNHIASH